jgi:NTE family protein
VGVNVSSVTLQEYPLDKDEKYLPRLLDYLLIAKSDSLEVLKNGIYLQPNLKDYSGFDFKKARELIQIGYDCAMAKMDQFEQKIERRITKSSIEAKRVTFLDKLPEWKFKPTELICLTGKASLYSQRMVRLKPEKLTLEHIKNTYFRLAETGNFESLHPTFLYDTTDATYQMCLQTKPNQNIELGIGGSIDSRNISQVFLAMNYRSMAKYSYTLSGSIFAGPFFKSMAGSFRLDYRTGGALYVEREVV